MSRVEYADPQAPAPSFGAPDTWEPRPSSPRATRAALASTVPLAISIVVFAIFITSYWLPETSRFAGRDWLLTQLSPLVSKYLTSAGQPLVDIQDNQLGVAGFLLLIFGSLIFWMARSRYWMARMWIWAPVLAGAAVCVATTAVLAIRNDLSRTSLSVILMIIWVAVRDCGSVAQHGGRCRVATAEEPRIRPVDPGRVQRAGCSGHCCGAPVLRR